MNPYPSLGGMKNLNSLFIERSVATLRQMEEAMARQVLYGGDLASHVLEQVGQDQESSLLLALSAYFHLDPAEAGPLPLPTDLAPKFPWELAIRHSFYPLRVEERTLLLAVSSPLLEEVEGDLFFYLNLPPRQLVTSGIRVRQALARDAHLSLDAREQRALARMEGRPLPSASVPPPALTSAPPSLRAMTLRFPAVNPNEKPPAGRGEKTASQDLQNPAWPQATRGLLRWMQRASRQEDRTRPRRRRGPMPLSECEDGFHQATTGEEVLQIFFEFAQQFFSYSAIFIVQGEIAEGRDSFGSGADQAQVAGIGIPLDLPSCFAQARNLGAPISIPLRLDGIDASLAADLKRSPRAAVFVLPILVRQRCVALLYGDNGDEPAELAEAAQVISAGALAGKALENLAMERKRMREEAPSSPSRKSTLTGIPTISGYSEGVPSSSHHRQQKAHMLARALGLPSQLPKAVTPPPTLASPQPSRPEEGNPFRRLTASFYAVSETTLAATQPAVPSATPAPITPFRPSARTSDAAAQVWPERVSSFERVSPTATTYPRSNLYSSPSPGPHSEQQLIAMPSILVHLDEEKLQLLDRLAASSENDQRTLEEVLKAGVLVVPMILTRLPGPLWVSKDAFLGGAVRPSQSGPLLRALVALRKMSLPFLVVQSGTTQVEQRRLATLMLGEFPYPEAAQGLWPRFFDTEPEIVRSALLAARWLRASPEVFSLLHDNLQRIQNSPNESAERRAKAQAALDGILK